MGRTRIETALAELKKRIECCEDNKKKILGCINQFKDKCVKREITYSEYEKLLNKKQDGKTLQDWLDYYDSYIKDCKERIKNLERKNKTKKIKIVFLFLAAIIILAVLVYYFRPVIVGLITQTPEQPIEPTEESYSETQEEAPPSERSEEPAVSSPSQAEEPLPSGTKPTLPSEQSELPSTSETEQTIEIPTSEPTEENITFPEISQAPENITIPEVQENITLPEAPETPENITEIKQTPVLIKKIPDLKIEKNKFLDLKISDYFSNAENYFLLQVSSLKTTTYDHVIRISSEKDFLGARTSKIIASNDFGTAESNFFNIIVSEASITEANITIPINITIENITEANATILTLQYNAVIGKPVKWKKQIQLEKQGIIKIKLPKEAENITVSKIIETSPEETPASYSETQEASLSERSESALSSPSQTEEPLPSEQNEPSLSSGTEPALPSEQSEEPSEELKKLESISQKIEELTKQVEELKETAKQKATENPQEEQTTQEAETIKQEAKASITGGITGQAISEQKTKKSIFSYILNFFKRVFSAITGRAITTEETSEDIEVTIEDNALKYEIEYETPAPQAFEQEISEKKKQITISAPDELNYTNILAFTQLQTEAKEEKIHLYHLTEQGREEVNITKYDLNNNSLIDYIEWNVPHLSNQTYELVIEISNAEHLNKNRQFIKNIYTYVNKTDNITYTIPKNEYVRAYFERNLTNKNFIDVYARNTEPATIEVYEKDSDVVIGKIENVLEGRYYISLNHTGSQNVFDLKSVSNEIIYDYIHDQALSGYPIGVFFEDYESGSLTTNGWEVGAGTEVFAIMARGNPGNSMSTDNTDAVHNATVNVSTVGYTDIWLTVNLRLNGLDDGEYGAIWWYNGTRWFLLFKNQTWAGGNYYTHSFNLTKNHTSANNNPALRIRFTNYANANNDYVDVDNVNVSGTAPPDTIYPTFNSFTSTPGNASNYVFNQIYMFNSTVANTNGTVGLEFNGTNYTARNLTANVYNVSRNGLSAGTYSYYWWARGNGTDKNYNTTQTYSYTINKTIPYGNLTNTTSWTVTYPRQTNISYAESNLGDSDVSYNVSRDNVYKNGGENITLAAGTYVYVLNTTGGMNYTANASMDTKTLVVNKNTSTQTSLTFDKTSPQSYPNAITPTCSLLVGQGTPALKVNGTTITSGNPITLGEGVWTFNCSIADNGNYSTAENVTTFTISQNNTYVLSLAITPSTTETYPTETTTTGSGCPSELICNLTLNTTGIVTNPHILTLSAGSYNYTYNTTGNANYSAKSVSNILTITQATGEINGTINGTQGNFSAINGSSTQNIYINATNKTGYGTGKIYVNGSLYNSGTMPLFNVTNLSIGFYNITFEYDGNENYTSDNEVWWVNVTISTADNPPQITRVYNESMTSVVGGLNSGPFYTSIIINFTAYDADSASDLNDSTARINFTKANEDTRQNLTCSKTSSGGNYANYTCNVTMWWWDAAGTWNIAAYIADNNSNSAQNTSTTFQVGSTTGFEISPVVLTWLAISARDINKTSNNDPLTLNNTGNVNISINNIQINATNLRGETDNTKALWAGNFSVAPFTGGTYPNEVECNATSVAMNASQYMNITNALLTRGNYTKNDGTAQEQLYFCLKIAGSELISQPYSTSQEGAWTIQILLAALIVKRIRRKKKKSKAIENLTIPSAIFSNKKLGCLEAITKYLKENLEMSYSEIAGILNRDDRTIWTTYKKAVKKQPEETKLEKTLIMLPIVKIEKTFIVVPVSIFEDKKLTILEAIIVYLKEKELKYIEIAKLLNRDQRNIWLIYSRAVKKLKRKV